MFPEIKKALDEENKKVVESLDNQHPDLGMK